ncbi:MAG TPA: acyltransferase [Gemmatimonadaceae bacterium]|nr:acyltransferase [Gemmatimonadaceae bacterium]
MQLRVPLLYRRAASSESDSAPSVSPGTVGSASAGPVGIPHALERIPSLDGIRAFSIMLVIGWHLASSGSAPWLEQLWRIDSGNLGVRLFFVISGYLITSLLLAEHARTGTVNLKRFYVRRALRIMPAFYFFLAVITLAAAAGLVPASRTALLRAATYTSNYLGTGWTLGHTWSLAVEEQFYLLWPSVIVLLGLRRSLMYAGIVLLLSPTFRGIAAITGHWPDNPRYSFECVADALATGCLLAYARPWLWNHASYRRLLERRAMELWPVVILVVAVANARWEHFGAIAGIALLNMAIAVWIDWCLRYPESRVGRILNARPIAFIGVLSYSIYLWQQPFLRPGHTLRFPLSILCIGALALISFYLVERPMLRLRARMATGRTISNGTSRWHRGRSAHQGV